MTTSEYTVRFNYKDYCQLPEDRRYEIIDGELYMAVFSGALHQIILRNLESMVWPHVRDNHLGQVFFGPFDVLLSEEDIVQPDLLFVAREHQGIISERGCEGPPDLIVEVLSLATSQRDREQKRALYAGAGVQEYWLVDPVSRTVDVMNLEAATLVNRGNYVRKDECVVSQVIPDLKLPVGEIFQRT